MIKSQVQGGEFSGDGAPGTFVTVELTGPLRRAAGTERVAVPCSIRITLSDLVEQLRELYPGTAGHLAMSRDETGRCSGLPAGLLVLREHQLLPTDPEFVVDAGNHIVLMPMISGG
ncbi:MAG: MoaD/ThiS family protein [Planctomycetota bacterium]